MQLLVLFLLLTAPYLITYNPWTMGQLLKDDSCCPCPNRLDSVLLNDVRGPFYSHRGDGSDGATANTLPGGTNLYNGRNGIARSYWRLDTWPFEIDRILPDTDAPFVAAREHLFSS